MKKSDLREVLRQIWRAIRESATRHVGVKILSIVLAIFLWGYVVSSDTSITRSKVLSGVGVQLTGQTILQRNNLALLTDVTSQLASISVEVEVSQSNYALVSSSNVDVVLDLSNITRAGTQVLSLRASTPYGRVTNIWPESVELQVEQLDTRYVPVNVEFVGDVREDYWYNAASVNPSSITVSGPASVVQQVSEAVAQVDVTDRTEPFNRSWTLNLMDGDGNILPTNVLTRTSTSSTVRTEVYPTKTIPISTEISDVFKGTVAEGFEITGVSISPESATVAADAELLESLDVLRITPISISNMRNSYSARASISELSGFENISPEQVYVTIEVAEQIASQVVDNVVVRYVNVSADFRVYMDDTQSQITVIATGPRSAVSELTADDLIAVVDLANYGPGEHEVPISIQLSSDEPEVTFNLTPSTVRVRIEEIE
ncbi:MAG TPA: hypothetical protein IAA84_10075 [Candidatus Alectryocaccomicrobium excrementavium]|uniref:YbbR-like protein n=1 Tax=Candidatus Alectryocaccomicrobium excrementavium TaxID=2840668 RepID=A0A9D1G2M1_9FIRM|nr:hypothetical protein [Candidatus Alectryocaccomicrobium excrementavium]